MGANNLACSSRGMSMIAEYEHCALAGYQDLVGEWTIGYGHTGSDVTQGLTITQDQALALLARDLTGAAACVNDVVTVTLTQNQFDD
jgi:lysozyme